MSTVLQLILLYVVDSLCKVLWSSQVNVRSSAVCAVGLKRRLIALQTQHRHLWLQKDGSTHIRSTLCNIVVTALFYRIQCTLCWRTPMRGSSPTQTCSSQHTNSNSSSSREVPPPLMSHLLPSHLIAQQEGIPLVGQPLSPPHWWGDKRWGRSLFYSEPAHYNIKGFNMTH